MIVPSISHLDGAGIAVVVADPPWPYKDSGRKRGGHAKHFSSMTLEGIEWIGQPLYRAMQRSTLLFLWTPNAMLADGSAGRICTAWGFVPKTVHTWVKMARNGKQKIGGGDYGRNSTEHFVVGRRGKPDLSRFCDAPAIPTAHLWPWYPRHSRKPEDFYSLVERVSDGPFLELFATQDRPGWYTWGDQL